MWTLAQRPATTSANTFPTVHHSHVRLRSTFSPLPILQVVRSRNYSGLSFFFPWSPTGTGGDEFGADHASDLLIMSYLYNPPIIAEAERCLVNLQQETRDDTSNHIPEYSPEPCSFWIVLYPTKTFPRNSFWNNLQILPLHSLISSLIPMRRRVRSRYLRVNWERLKDCTYLCSYQNPVFLQVTPDLHLFYQQDKSWPWSCIGIHVLDEVEVDCCQLVVTVAWPTHRPINAPCQLSTMTCFKVYNTAWNADCRLQAIRKARWAYVLIQRNQKKIEATCPWCDVHLV